MSVDFDGTDDTVGFGTSVTQLENVVQKTVLAWCNPDTFGESGLGRILDMTSPVTLDGWASMWRDTGPNPDTYSYFQTFTGANGQWRTPDMSITLGQLVHVVAVYDRSAPTNDPLLYINAVSQAVTELSTPTGAADNDAGFTVTIGSRSNGEREFNGRIFHIQIFNRLLTAAEIQTIFACRGSDGIVFGRVFDTPLNEGPDFVAATGAGAIKDVAVGKHDGTGTGNVHWNATEVNRRRKAH